MMDGALALLAASEETLRGWGIAVRRGIEKSKVDAAGGFTR
jgi:hypothetical protein